MGKKPKFVDFFIEAFFLAKLQNDLIEKKIQNMSDVTYFDLYKKKHKSTGKTNYLSEKEIEMKTFLGLMATVVLGVVSEQHVLFDSIPKTLRLDLKVTTRHCLITVCALSTFHCRVDAD